MPLLTSRYILFNCDTHAYQPPDSIIISVKRIMSSEITITRYSHTCFNYERSAHTKRALFSSSKFRCPSAETGAYYTPRAASPPLLHFRTLARLLKYFLLFDVARINFHACVISFLRQRGGVV